MPRRPTPCSSTSESEQISSFPLANGEPVTVLDAVEAAAGELDRVLCAPDALLPRPAVSPRSFGDRCTTSPTSCPTSPGPASGRQRSTWSPNNFSEIRDDAERSALADPLIVAAASPPDRHGYFSLGVNADYMASFIGRARFFLEAKPRMPRTFGRSRCRQPGGGVVRSGRAARRGDPPRRPVEPTGASAASSLSGYRNGATMQAGIGSIPNAILPRCAGHRDSGCTPS